MIARPAAIFGAPASEDGDGHSPEKGTPGERLGAVGYVTTVDDRSLLLKKHGLFSVALLGVLGSTGACKVSSVDHGNP